MSHERRHRRALVALVSLGTSLLVTLAFATRPALAHAGSLGGSLRSVPAPFWLVVVSGGGIVGLSFLVSAFVTDDETLGAFARRHVYVGQSVELVATALRIGGVLGLLVVFGSTLFGPPVAIANLGVLLVWVGWWAGFTMLTYLVVDVWPVVNPWRTLGGLFRTVHRADTRILPKRVGSWPSVVGLLGLVWVEVVSPLAATPRALAVVVAGYTVVTLAGAVVYGDDWFEYVDPLSRVFRLYGLLAPIQRTDGGLSISFPGSALARVRTSMDADDVAFVVALLWVTTFDGLVATVAWSELLDAVAPVPSWSVNLFGIVAGFLFFFVVYRRAAIAARRTADTYVTGDFIAGWFAPALVPIAAGYHLAHFAGYVIGLAPALGAVATAPLSPPAAISVVSVPDWFGGVQLAFVVLGHLLSVWVAHTRSFDIFPGRLQPLRSQYPFVVVTICYTATSLWVVAQPTIGGVAG
ncbi:hypothetical protein GJR96_12195 [Haloferax sp. MBLA0076]|uniref:Uncharacterized protein n=1 Tax=Haloferax litoreum TaxID=2666140 RepID=A0A6A8GKV1_9EURY|nr:MULTISPECIES: hypothetical protein [Haloferax]KAB1194149.1 hypothetical protein Hfx1148_12135 [Haloferax sp. CBA1148]MRX22707.1 hypothetical protein [Haloferax litoreum]